MIAFIIYDTRQIVNVNNMIFVPREEFIDNSNFDNSIFDYYRENVNLIHTNPEEIIKQNFACSYKRISMMHGNSATYDPVQDILIRKYRSVARFIDIIIFDRDEDAIQCKLSFPTLDEYVLSELWPTN